MTVTRASRLRRHVAAFRDLPLFSTEQARADGISGHDLALLVRQRLIWRAAQGWYSCRPDATEDERHILRTVANLRLLGDGAAACRVSAALLHGLPVARCDLSTVEIATVGLSHGRTRRGVRVSEFAAKGVECVDVHVPLVDATVRVVDPVTAIVGTAMSNNPMAGLVAADHALRLEVCTTEDLSRAVASRTGSRGIAAARRALEHVEGRHESPGETLTAAILRNGPWEFDPQVRARARGHNYRVDFALREYKIAIEFDGEVKYTGPEVMARQLARDADLRAEGWIVLHFVWADLTEDSIILDQIRAAVDEVRAAA